MLKVKFEADIHDDGMLEIPDEYKKQLVGKHVKLVVVADEAMPEKEATQFSDEYIEKHWQKLIHQGLSHYDGDYYKSEQYYLDRGNAGMEKYA